MSAYRSLALVWTTTSGVLVASAPAPYIMRGENLKIVLTADRDFTLPGAEFTAVLKLTAEPDSPPLFQAVEFTRTAFGVFTASLIVSFAGIDAALGVGEGVDQPSVPCVFQVFVQEASVMAATSDWLPITLKNNYARLEDETPLALPTPSDWLTARALRFDVTQTLTNPQKARALSNLGGSLGSGSGLIWAAPLTVVGSAGSPRTISTFGTWQEFNLSGSGTQNVILDATGTVANAPIGFLLNLAAGSTAIINFYNESVGGTPLFTATCGVTAGTADLLFIFNGTAWVRRSSNLTAFATGGGGGGGGEVPLDLSAFTAPTLRYCAASLAADADGTAVASWTSIGSTTTAAAQSDNAKKPTKQTLTSKAVISFDGGDYLDLATAILGQATYCIIAKVRGSGVSVGDVTPGSCAFRIGRNGDDTADVMFCNDRDGLEYVGDTPVDITATKVYSIRVAGNVPTGTYDGSPVTFTQVDSLPLGLFNFARIGATAGGGIPFVGDIVDLLIFSGSVPSDADAIETALMA